MNKTDRTDLMKIAEQAMLNSYSPYSGYKVGAALLCADGTVISACNVENASFSATVCAERSAFCKAVSMGKGKNDFSEIAVVGGKDGIIDRECTPCGICRQVMSEFCSGDFLIHCKEGNGIKTYKLSELLPHGFDGDGL